MWAKIEARLVSDWKTAWRWTSMWAMGGSTLLLATWATIPDELKAVLPHRAVEGIAVALLVLGMGGRLVKQSPPPPPKP